MARAPNDDDPSADRTALWSATTIDARGGGEGTKAGFDSEFLGLVRNPTTVAER